MSATEMSDLSSRLDAVVAEARGQVEAFQAQAEETRREIAERFRKFVPIAERIITIGREKLERLKERLQFDVIPSQMETDRFFLRAVTLDVKTDLAGIVKFGFSLSNDSDVRNIVLDYNLQITPIFFRYVPHARLEMPLEAYDEAAVGKWLDDRIVDFANDFLMLHATKQHQERAMVSDPVAGIRFPKYFAAATLDHDGTTHYFISEESRREYAKRNGLNP